MRFITFVLAALCAQAAGAQPAGAGAVVRPGAWIVTPQGGSSASLSYQLCFKSGSLDDLKLLLPTLTSAAGCPQPRITLAREQLDWQFACPVRSIQADARYALTAESVDGTFTITQGTPAVTSGQTIKARYTGACTP